MGLSGPTRTIVVEPVQEPVREPVVVPEPVPAEAPVREEPVPEAPVLV
jgi:hypothetical protein